MTRHRRDPPHLRVVSEGLPDRDIILAWHDAMAGGAADRIVGRLMECIAAKLSALNLADAIPAGVDAAIIHGALRGSVVVALRRNLIRRAIAAREEPKSLAGKTRYQRIAYLVAGEPDHAP